MRTVVVVLSFFLSLSIFAQDKKTTENEKGPRIEFAKDVFNYGTIYANSGHDGLAEFKFINSGNEPLVLTNVKAGCGCTSPFWQKDPVLPGDSGKVILKYTTLRHPHTINKSAVVNSNAVNSPTVVIRITGTVLAQPEVMLPEKNTDKTASPFAN